MYILNKTKSLKMIIILFNVYAVWLHEVEKGSVVARTVQSLAVRSCGCTLYSHTQQKGRKQRRLRKKGEEVSGRSYSPRPKPKLYSQDKNSTFPPTFGESKNFKAFQRQCSVFIGIPPTRAAVQIINTTGLFKETGTLMC